MASLQRSASGLIYLAFRYDGKRFLRSLETYDEEEARQAKVLVERTLKHLRDGVLRLAESVSANEFWQFVRSGGQCVKLPTIRSSMSLEDVCQAYLDSFDESAKEGTTLGTERAHLNHFKKILGEGTGIEAITSNELREYVVVRKKEKGLRGGKVKPVTIGKELQTWSQLWDYAKDEGLVDGENPGDGIRKPRGDEKPPFMTWEQIKTRIGRGGLDKQEIAELWDCLFLRENEVGSFLGVVQERAEGLPRFPYAFPALAFCAYTGARRSEMFRCQIDDVNGSVLVREKKKSKERRITFRDVPLHPGLKQILDEWLEMHPGGQFMFCKGNKNPLEDRTSREAFKAVTKGTKWSVLRGYHVLRHSFASNLARRGVDQRVIDEFMGHQTEEMRRRYRHLFPEDGEKAITVLNFAANG